MESVGSMNNNGREGQKNEYPEESDIECQQRNHGTNPFATYIYGLAEKLIALLVTLFIGHREGL
ncbi:MAG: hypothetical protein JSS83_05940 [Cyanobacteria bacterium SZAS LIN-3]|nr:hypothetical protein [Cyanobacteria bacterium SZAS LIN-3]